MKAAVLYNDREIRLGQAPDPQVGPDDVLANDGYCQAGYGILTEAEKEAAGGGTKPPAA